MSKVNVNIPISGLNLYQDSKNRMVYYNPMTKKASFVPKDQFKKFNMYKSRYFAITAILLVSVIIFHDWFKWNIWIPVALTLVIWAFIEYSFWKFQKSLPDDPKFDKSKCRHSFDQKLTGEQRQRGSLRMVLYIVLGVLLVVNGYQLDYDPLMLTFCYLAMAFCLFQAGFILWQLSRK